ncbi:hypothetical protein N7517_006902 [Penicillium concentricum]|uniref:Microbial-type PARG catalytic domain-containing protein n=1 Tax=Penicillium concentricum TaxID=293559 RepID=A0A9W9SA65_9EURO|nr:uncharacterized protein N7517_006902 [Penicillium concentricum]KAJ5374896.1 hypothetical protein N7517_006902 [Penicillium concentricum]
MPKQKPVQSDTSASTQSQLLDSQYANQSPTISANSRSSGGLTRMMSTIYEKFSSGSNGRQIGGLDGASSPDERERKTDLRKAPEVKKQPTKKPPPLPKKRHSTALGSRGGGVTKPSAPVSMQNVIKTTKEATEEILSKTELEGTRFSYVASKWTAPSLDPDLVEFPNLTTVVKVVPGDTYDQALDMQDAGNTSDFMPVCVLNFANAFHPGGGWLSGSRAQEEQLCYRSTLIESLHSHFYPMTDLECLYSPKVIVFRESVEKGYTFMSEDDELHLNPAVSVISMAARDKPKLTADKSAYRDPGQRYLMKGKMRLILRTAAVNNHRRLVLGALGCGAFHHPPQVVADCWKEVLMKREFRGWFEQIYFVIRDAPHEKNLAIFKGTLDGLNMG